MGPRARFVHAQVKRSTAADVFEDGHDLPSIVPRRSGTTGRMASTMPENPEPLPVACSLTPEEMRERQSSLIPALLERAVAIGPSDEGYRLHFKSDSGTLRTIVEMIAAESQCCPFLQFDLSVPPAQGDVTLTVSGPPGTRAFLDALFGYAAEQTRRRDASLT